jgi:hypothetical protein
MIEGFDMETITRVRKLKEGSLFTSDSFNTKHNKHIPTWLMFTWWACFVIGVIGAVTSFYIYFYG